MLLRRLIWTALGASLLGACSGGSAERPETLGTVTSALTLSDVLSFEDAGLWTAQDGSKTLSSVHSQGSSSVQVQTTWYTTLTSSPMALTGDAGDEFSVDVRLGSSVGWGEVRLVLIAPSLGLHQQVDAVLLAPLAPGAFHSVTFSIAEPWVQALLAQHPSDLSVRLAFNSPPNSYWVDNGQFSGSVVTPSCTDGLQNGDETGVDCGGSCAPCATCGDSLCQAQESCDTCSQDCGACSSTCSDGELNGNETEEDCGGSCAPCGAAAPGLLFWDKFSDGMGQWTGSGFSAEQVAHTVEYTDAGSEGLAATAIGAGTLTSPPIDLSGSEGAALLRFQRLIDASPGTSTLLEVNPGSGWQVVRDLGSYDANDNRWRTEFLPLDSYAGVNNFQFRITSDGAATIVQVDDVEVSDRTAIDNTYVDQQFILVPGNDYTQPSQGWQWKSAESAAWSSETRSGVFKDIEGTNDSWPDPPAGVEASDLWLRAWLQIDAGEDLSALRFWARWDDHLKIWVNSTLVVDEDSWSPSYQYVDTLANAFRDDYNNEIVVHAHDLGGGRFVDVGISRAPVITSTFETVDPPAFAHGGSDPLAGFADIIYDYMPSRAVPGLGFALYKDGTRVLESAYGARDRAGTEPMPLNPVMRLASVDKSYVVIAAQALLDAGVTLADGQPLTRNTQIFPTLRGAYQFPALQADAGTDADLVTYGQLMDHTAHVRNFAEGGNAWFYSSVDSERGHTTHHDNAVYIHNNGCYLTPGTLPGKYNNGGYMLLRYFIDQITDQGFLGYLRDQIQGDVFLSYESLLGRNSREPWYSTERTPYDRWINFEHYLGLAASPRSAAELGIDYHLINGAHVPYGGVTSGCEVRNGGMPGSSGFAAQCERGITFALLFNGHQEEGSYWDLVEQLRDYAFSLSDADYQ